MEEVLNTTRTLVRSATEAGVVMRALGGAAVALRCPSALRPPLARAYGDVDFLARARDRGAMTSVMAQDGWMPNARFNAVNGHRRLLFETDAGEHIDVFLDEFAMCHRLDLKDRLTLDPETISLGDLVLTKLQISKLNYKDAQDVAAILADHEVGTASDEIDAVRLSDVVCSDWGWWRTVGESLAKMRVLVDTLGLEHAAHDAVIARVAALEEILEGPKSRRWKLRARVGERVPWREDPEEVDR